MRSDRETVMVAFAELDAAFDNVLGLSFDAPTHSEKLALQDRMERKWPTRGHSKRRFTAKHHVSANER